MMTSELQFLATITLVFIVLVFVLSMRHNSKVAEREEMRQLAKEEKEERARQEKRQKVGQEPVKKQTQKSSDIIDTLDWMLAHGIITPQEYTQLIGKCLPFIQ